MFLEWGLLEPLLLCGLLDCELLWCELFEWGLLAPRLECGLLESLLGSELLESLLMCCCFIWALFG